MNYITELPPEYQERASRNTEVLPTGEPDETVIINAFWWKESTEGHEFWNAVWNANNESELPELPTYE